jgi:hypothetical protein
MLTMLSVGGWSHGHPSSSKFYWESDIYAMAEILGPYEKNIHMRKPGAKQALETFKAGRQAHVRSILEVALFSFHIRDQLSVSMFSMPSDVRTGYIMLL